MRNFLNLTKVSKDKRAKFNSVIEDSPDFRKIYKPYRKVNNYPDFREVALGLAMSTLSAEAMGLNNVDTTLKEVAYSAKFIAHHPTPVYWLEEKLVEAFLETEIPTSLSLLANPAIPYFILMLPPLLKNPDGELVKFVFIHNLENNSKTQSFEIGDNFLHHINSDKHKLRWVTALSNGSAYSLTVELPEVGTEGLKYGEFEIHPFVNYAGGNQDIFTEKDFTDKVDRLVVNTLLYLKCFNGKALSEDLDAEVVVAAGKGFGKNNKSASPTHFLNPVWIGKGYQPRQRKANKADEEISRKYQIHTKHFWRRGHYRYVPVGKREEGERKLTWIEPVLISR